MDKVLTVLLVEDDVRVCREIEDYICTLDDVALVGTTNNSTEASQLVRETLPDAVILDLELYAGGGSGLSFLQDLQTDPVEKRPYIVVTTHNSSVVTYAAAQELGADYTFCKHQEGYSSGNVVDFLRMLKGVIHSHVRSTDDSGREIVSPAQKQKQLSRRVYTELDAVGISPKVAGYAYLAEAIQLAMEKRSTNLCDEIGKKYGKTSSSVERAMQNAIAKAWRSVPIEELLANYTAKINQTKGFPTLTEFVYYYATKLRNLQ